jgi:hypothetical protein
MTPPRIRFELDRSGELDEVFFRNSDVHIERMADKAFWIGIDMQDGTHFAVNTGVEKGIWYFRIEEGFGTVEHAVQRRVG